MLRTRVQEVFESEDPHRKLINGYTRQWPFGHAWVEFSDGSIFEPGGARNPATSPRASICALAAASQGRSGLLTSRLMD